MDNAVFNQEMRRMLMQYEHLVLSYINKEFKKSKWSSYYGFLDDFLFHYGINSLNFSPALKTNKYLPYINCTTINIFRENKGVVDLAKEATGKAECQKILVSYIIDQFLKLHVENFITWNPELNYGVN